MTADDELFTVAFDIKKMRPGCVLIQAALGATIPTGLFYKTFATDSWLLVPTDDMRVYRTTRAELEQLKRKTAAAQSGVDEP